MSAPRITTYKEFVQALEDRKDKSVSPLMWTRIHQWMLPSTSLTSEWLMRWLEESRHVA